MLYYSVYLKKEIRHNCKCGKCVNHNKFKNDLSTWHAVPLIFTPHLDLAINLHNSETVLMSQENNWRFESFEDSKIIK